MMMCLTLADNYDNYFKSYENTFLVNKVLKQRDCFNHVYIIYYCDCANLCDLLNVVDVFGCDVLKFNVKL